MNEELGSSELGTLDYWEGAYKDELRNLEDHGDIGEVWFGEDSVGRIIRWIASTESIRLEDHIIDVGCGNGFTLIELAREGYTRLTGVDYSPEAIRLAQAVAQVEFPFIQYEVMDVTSGNLPERHINKYRIVHDKGTYDAVSLSPENSKTKRAAYIETVEELMTDDGFLVLTSCNWTEKELVDDFSSKFKIFTTIPSPQFKFGGKVGSVVSSVVFVKK